MGKRYNELSDSDIAFIAWQKIFFTGTAAEGHVNIFPKGMDSLRVLSSTRVIWLNVTGSGNETSAHVQQNPRITIMFCAFEGAPLILRLYGTSRVIHRNDSEWDDLVALFPTLPGARQIFDLSIDMVQTSCGMAVPFFDYAGEREMLTDWAIKKGEEGIKKFWEDRNQISLDGLPTHILEKNA